MIAPGAVLLALDTSTPTGSVAVGGADGVLAEISVRVGIGHSSALLPAIDFALRSAGTEPAALAGVVVGGGPGSFTGVRLAAATAKGIVHALGVDLYSYSSLLVAAAQAWAAADRVCALFDARGRDVYAACYSFQNGIDVLLPPIALSLDRLLERWGGEDGFPLFIGDGALRHREELEREGARVGPVHFAAPGARALLWLACDDPAAGRVEEPHLWEPEYVRPPGAVRIAAQAAKGTT